MHFSLPRLIWDADWDLCSPASNGITPCPAWQWSSFRRFPFSFATDSVPTTSCCRSVLASEVPKGKKECQQKLLCGFRSRSKEITFRLGYHTSIKARYSKWNATVYCKAKDGFIINNTLKIQNLHKINLHYHDWFEMQTETSVVQLPMALLLAPLDSGLVSDVFHFLLQQTLCLQPVAVDLS